MNDLQRSQSVAHGAAAEVVHVDTVGVPRGLSLDGERLWAVSVADVCVQESPGFETAPLVGRVVAIPVVDVQVDVVGVGLPRQHEVGDGLSQNADARLSGLGSDLVCLAGGFGCPLCSDHGGVVPKDLVHALVAGGEASLGGVA